MGPGRAGPGDAGPPPLCRAALMWALAALPCLLPCCALAAGAGRGPRAAPGRAASPSTCSGLCGSRRGASAGAAGPCQGWAPRGPGHLHAVPWPSLEMPLPRGCAAPAPSGSAFPRLFPSLHPCTVSSLNDRSPLLLPFPGINAFSGIFIHFFTFYFTP